MKLTRAVIASVFCAILLVACGSKASNVGDRINLRADISNMAESVAEYNQNASLSPRVVTLDDFKTLVTKNKKILDALEAKLEIFSEDLSNLWAKLPTTDNSKYPAKQKMKDWLDGWTLWVSAQRQMQAIAEKCVIDSAGFKLCLAPESSKIATIDSSAFAQLKIAAAPMNEWLSKHPAK